jgi:hypothetical protein
MKKIIAIASLIATPTFSAEVCETNSPYAKYCENAATNTITLENVVDIYSSRQNVWVCGAGIASDGGSDNRLYYTATVDTKGRDSVNPPVLNKVIEAPVDGSFATTDSAKNLSNLVLANYFDESTEVKLSNLRVELASLNYGAEIYVDICGETPFSYFLFPDEDFNGEDPRRNLALALELTNKYQQITPAGSTDYVTYADLEWLIEGWSTGQTVTTSDNIVANGQQGGWVRLGDMADTSCNSNASFCNSDFALIPSATSEVSVKFDVNGYDRTHGGQNGNLGQHANDLKKYVVRYTLKETATTTKRLKGLTEAASWKQGISSKMDIKN